MLGQLTPDEQAQLNQTIEMFEVITASQPLDYQSLEILKEAYLKLERQRDVIRTAKRIASAYVQLGQLSSALLEYETILQHYPDDPEVLAAMAEIQSKAASIDTQQNPPPEEAAKRPDSGGTGRLRRQAAGAASVVDEGREGLRKVFVDGRIITEVEFDTHWRPTSPDEAPEKPLDPFIQILAERGNVPLEKSLKALSDRARVAFIAVERYDIDTELARTFPKDLCRRWCVLPFDRMSKSVLVATANPFNKRAEEDIQRHTSQRVIWYLAAPVELQKIIEKLFH